MLPCQAHLGSVLQVQTSANISAQGQQVIQQFFLPWLGMLDNGTRTNAVIMGQGSSATA